MKTIIAAAVLSLSTLSFAGDVAKLTHIGFSSDGKSYAYMQSGIQDGSGFAYANIQFIDTLNNKFAAADVKVIQQDEEVVVVLPEIEAAALKQAEATLKNLEITTKGDVLVSRKISDLEARKLKEVSFSNGALVHGLTAPQYKLKLTLSKAAAANCMTDGMAQKLKLELINQQTKKVSVLQNDKSLPPSRGCVHNYEIEDVIVINPDQMSEQAARVVVLLRTFSYGFEGEDVRFMAISGALNVE
jgi:predicted secreted protein